MLSNNMQIEFHSSAGSTHWHNVPIWRNVPVVNRADPGPLNPRPPFAVQIAAGNPQ